MGIRQEEKVRHFVRRDNSGEVCCMLFKLFLHLEPHSISFGIVASPTHMEDQCGIGSVVPKFTYKSCPIIMACSVTVADLLSPPKFHCIESLRLSWWESWEEASEDILCVFIMVPKCNTAHSLGTTGLSVCLQGLSKNFDWRGVFGWWCGCGCASFRIDYLELRVVEEAEKKGIWCAP